MESSSPNKRETRRPRKPKSLCLPFETGEYQSCMEDHAHCREYIMERYEAAPELFPAALSEGFTFNGFIHSKKQDLTQRRIKLNANDEQYQIRPSFMMPYMIGPIQQVEKALYFRRWGVPFEALAYGFGRNPMYWYRAYVSLGRPSLVGTTIKTADRLPAHVLADEKHSRRRGHKVYIPTTVAQECILGAEVVESAGEEDLKKGYQVFRDEARALQADYTPDTVNTDGWAPTHNAWKALFPLITILLCFLHFVLSIKNRCRSDKGLLSLLQDKVWAVYHAETRASFAQRLRRLREWVTPTQMATTVIELASPRIAVDRAIPLSSRASPQSKRASISAADAPAASRSRTCSQVASRRARLSRMSPPAWAGSQRPDRIRKRKSSRRAVTAARAAR